MLAILHSLGMFIVDLFKPPCRLEAENLFLRHQLSIDLRRAPPRLRLRNADRVLLIWMTRIWPSLLGAAQVVHPRPTDLTWIALAKSVRGASDWHRASRVLGPDADLWRIAPAANSFFLCGVLQSGPYALGLGQRHAAGSGSPAVRRHCRHPNLVRLAPPLRPDMIFGKDSQPSSLTQSAHFVRQVLTAYNRRELLTKSPPRAGSTARRTLACQPGIPSLDRGLEPLGLRLIGRVVAEEPASHS